MEESIGWQRFHQIVPANSAQESAELRVCVQQLQWPPLIQHTLWRGFLGVVGLLELAANVCREAGGRVTIYMRIQDMDIVVPNQFDERRRFALVPRGDTTVISTLCGMEATAPVALDVNGAVLQAIRRWKES